MKETSVVMHEGFHLNGVGCCKITQQLLDAARTDPPRKILLNVLI